MIQTVEAAAVLQRRHPPRSATPTEVGWKDDQTRAYYAEALSALDEAYKRAHRSAPHSPRIFGNRVPQLQELRLEAKSPSKSTFENVDLGTSVAEVAMFETEGVTVSRASVERDSVVEDSAVVMVTEEQQEHMRDGAMAVRIKDVCEGDVDNTACRCMSSSAIFSPNKGQAVEFARRCKQETALAHALPKGVVSIPTQHHASLTTHSNGESRFYEDHHRGVVLHYRLFGHTYAPQKILFIMGLATQGCAWSYQAEYFRQFKDYQVCIFDNRGIGLSSKPLGRYTTSVMAEDAACLLDHLRWNQYRSVHVVGISMGGMIAQEVALLVPDRILSLALLCTYSGGLTFRKLPAMSGATKFFSYVRKCTALGYVWGEAAHQESMMRFLFQEASIREEGERLRTYMAESIRDGGISVLGSMLQYPAVLTHHCSVRQLRTIRFCPFKKLVATGSDDDIVHPRNSHWLASHLGSDLVVIEGTGHGITAEKPDVINSLLHKHFIEAVQHFRKTHHPLQHLHAD